MRRKGGGEVKRLRQICADFRGERFIEKAGTLYMIGIMFVFLAMSFGVLMAIIADIFGH